MSGPSLQLGVNAAGKDTLTGLNDQLERLRSNLTALKAGKADLTGLSGANEELKKLRIEFAESGQALRTSFAELAEAIRGGLSQAAEETQKGAAKQRSLVAQERAQLQAEYENAIRDRRQFTQDELQVIRDAGVRLIEADRAMLAARNAANKTNSTALSGGEFRNPNPGSKESEIEAAYAAQARQSAAAYEAAKASAWVQAESLAAGEMQRAQDQSLSLWAANEKRTAAERVRIAKETAASTQAGIVAAEEVAAAETAARVAAITQAQTLSRQAPVYASRANSAFEAEAQAAADAKAAAWVKAEMAAATEMQRAQDQSLAMWSANEKRTAAERLRIAKESAAAEAAGLAAANDFAAAESARITKLQVGSAKIAEAQLAAAATEQEARATWIAKMQTGSAKIAEEQRLAADREAAAILAAAEKIAQAEAAYQLKTARSQIVTQVQARASLDAGVPAKVVAQDFGPTATSAAQAATSVGDLVAKHKQLGEEAAAAKPKVASLSAAMGELHSAARGVASGFSAMFLTWGSIVPLLAGAALSNAFVQTVKQGAAVEQTLAVIKELSDETDGSIDMLRSRLLTLASNGPQGPKEVAEAMKALSLAGLDAVSVATAVKQALTLSIVGEMPAKQAAEALVAISTAFGFSAGQFNRVNDVVAKAAAISMSSVEGMTASFRIASPVAQQYGVSIEDVATQLAVLANIGIRNQQAGTAVTQFYAGLAATTRKGSDAIKLLIGDTAKLRDSVTGNFKPAFEILDMLNAGLAKLKPAAQSDALSAVFNNRAIRDAASSLLAARKPSFDDAGKVATDATGKVITEWDKLSKQIEESYGFAAIAMANLSLTAENQMKSVLSALQGSFVATFKELEPEILLFSKQLRDAFNSEDFRSTLSGLANTIGNIVVFISRHTDALKLAAEAWLIYKGAMIGAALLQGAASSFEAIAVALAAVRTASLTAAVGFGLVRAAMGPIAFVLSGLITLWGIYKVTSQTATITAADTIKLRTDQIVESLNKESERLEQRNQLIREGISAREADIRVAGQQALAEQELAGVKQRSVLDKQETDLRAQRAKLQQPTGGLVGAPEDVAALQIAEAQRGIDIAKIDEKINAIAAERVRLTQQELAGRTEVKTAIDRQVAAAKDAAKLNPPERPKAIPGGTEDFRIPKPLAEAQDELSGLRTIFSERMAALKKELTEEQKIRDTAHTSGIQSDVQYQIETQIAEEDSFAKRRSLLQQFIADSARALAVLKTDPTKDDKAKAQEQKNQDLLRQQETELVNEKRLADMKKAGSENKQDQDITKFIAQQTQALQLQKEQIDIQQALSTLTSDQRAIEEARLAAAGKFNDQIREQQRLLEKAKAFQTSLLAQDNEPRPDLLAAADAEVARQQAALARLRTAQKQAGDFGATNLAEKLKPQWQLLLEGWKNVTEQMKVAYDGVVQTVIDNGQTMWLSLVTTGKASATEMLHTIRDIILKQIYQQQIAPAFAQLGQGVAGILFGARPTASATGSPIDTAALKTATSLETLNSTGVNPLFGSLQRLIAAAESAADALLGVRGGGGGGSEAGLLGSLFGGGGEGGAIAGGGLEEGDLLAGVIGSARGNVFGFAKGSAFTNQTFAQPTPFTFKSGGRFAPGIMAESGPEAVMPLKRGGDGSLGVVWHGGGGSGYQPQSNVSVVIENHTDGKARVQETKKGDGTREIRVIVDAAVAAVAQDVRSGGPVSQAIETQYGSNRAVGLMRR